MGEDDTAAYLEVSSGSRAQESAATQLIPCLTIRTVSQRSLQFFIKSKSGGISCETVTVQGTFVEHPQNSLKKTALFFLSCLERHSKQLAPPPVLTKSK